MEWIEMRSDSDSKFSSSRLLLVVNPTDLFSCVVRIIRCMVMYVRNEASNRTSRRPLGPRVRVYRSLEQGVGYRWRLRLRLVLERTRGTGDPSGWLEVDIGGWIRRRRAEASVDVDVQGTSHRHG